MAITETSHHGGPRRAVLDEEDTSTTSDQARFAALVTRLSEQSVAKHYDAFADIAWDDPEFAVDPDDPRWILREPDALSRTEWYKAQPDAVQARIGLYRWISAAKLGMEFENVLSRGLLEFALFKLGNDDPRFRYVLHEVAEETHHSMMFQEFVDRSGLDVRGLPIPIRRLANGVVKLSRRFPPLFFFFVLGGEDPIDHVQRRFLRSEGEAPPILETIMRHHITEEARHLSFARHYLKLEVPTLSLFQRARLSVAVPVILGLMATWMVEPSHQMVREFEIPADVIKQAYRTDPEGREFRVESVRKVRRLARELGLMNPVSVSLWRRFGIYSRDED
jgi:hypothetical protein